MFSDADGTVAIRLLASYDAIMHFATVPVIVSSRNMKQNIVETVSGDKSFSASASVDEATEEVLKILSEVK